MINCNDRPKFHHPFIGQQYEERGRLPNPNDRPVQGGHAGLREDKGG